MALNIGELRSRTAELPAWASLYWYTEDESVVIRAEWTEPGEDVGDFHAEEVMRYAAIQTGGQVL